MLTWDTGLAHSQTHICQTSPPPALYMQLWVSAPVGFLHDTCLSDFSPKHKSFLEMTFSLGTPGDTLFSLI